MNVSGFIDAKSKIKFRAKCLCGNSFNAKLERRKQYRKSTNLPGTYEIFSKAKNNNNGLLTIEDLSRTGMKLKIFNTKNISVGDILMVQFCLDDALRSLLNKMVIVKHRHHQCLGTEFAPTETLCKTLSFYLLN
jgi:c-di-GMP-binding flagellar brake protein YcgR